ncbi:hypothetical protein G6F35_010406 [Rhizopus arrhizus]|nr:hypothetical protein G6F35_010406 [Rhizopus arrhizus]
MCWHPTGAEAPSKPLGSQEQEQEQEQEQDSSSSLRSDSSAPLALTLVGGTDKEKEQKADLKARKADRIRQIAEEAQVAFNATLAKPVGLLAKCTVLNKTRLKAVENALPTVRQLCQQLFGSERVTPQFWKLYFESVAEDDFSCGKGPYNAPHENWRPDFLYLLRDEVIAKLADRALSEAA